MRALVALLAAVPLLAAAMPAAAAEPAKAAKPAPAAKPAAGRTVEMKVTDDGFVPEKVEAKKGEPLTLVITRLVEKTCATDIVVKDYGINTPLPLGKAVTVRFTPTKSGQVRFACAMDMIGGVVVVQ